MKVESGWRWYVSVFSGTTHVKQTDRLKIVVRDHPILIPVLLPD
jgi:hypothetical protein